MNDFNHFYESFDFYLNKIEETKIKVTKIMKVQNQFVLIVLIKTFAISKICSKISGIHN